eukprot:TRINITY_DN4267_c0_g1_i1.p1 TRINITY_DN4267_c0_g1~~TRINITY_DN4267_c0_g1_i1.p1  ORF type:complete len:347 (+),score=48.37 TRINITY_DN4267_c0_g1_i1:52-1092(+)
MQRDSETLAQIAPAAEEPIEALPRLAGEGPPQVRTARAVFRSHGVATCGDLQRNLARADLWQWECRGINPKLLAELFDDLRCIGPLPTTSPSSSSSRPHHWHQTTTEPPNASGTPSQGPHTNNRWNTTSGHDVGTRDLRRPSRFDPGVPLYALPEWTLFDPTNAATITNTSNGWCVLPPQHSHSSTNTHWHMHSWDRQGRAEISMASSPEATTTMEMDRWVDNTTYLTSSPYNGVHELEGIRIVANLDPSAATEPLTETYQAPYSTSNRRSGGSQAGDEALQQLLVHLTNKVEELEQRLQCAVCAASEVNAVFIPCGHHTCCVECASVLDRCPICRLPGNVFRTYT